jgi:hypothetical protein
LIDPVSASRRFSKQTRNVFFEVGKIWGNKSLELMRRNIPFLPREILYSKSSAEHNGSDLVHPDVMIDSILTLRCSLSARIETISYHDCIASNGAFVFKSSVKVNSIKVIEINDSKMDFNCIHFESFTFSSETFD